MQTLTAADLQASLERIDGRGYKAYKDIVGGYEFSGWTLHIDHVQGDPFASPSKVRIRVGQSLARLPQALVENRTRRMALRDFLARRIAQVIEDVCRGRRGIGTSGLVSIDRGGQEVLERTAVLITSGWVEARMEVGLPAAGRSVLGKEAQAILCQELPRIVQRALVWSDLPEEVRQSGETLVHSVENQEHIRCRLDELGLVAFVADGSVLARESGASDRPLERGIVAFRSPESHRVRMEIPHPVRLGTGPPVSSISGMGIRRGVTLIVGGGHHGKSTLLKALERGVYPHVPDDGREYVVTCRDAVKIRAEDGRRVEQVDISPFIDKLPYGRTTKAFSTDDASGSTSQAANIMEALEMGATTLLLDEDTSATNFMVRDARMQSLVRKGDEPITAFIDRVRELYENLGVSTVLIMGGCGDYFDTADTVIRMREYLPADVTEAAKAIAATHPTHRVMESDRALTGARPRIPLSQSFDPSRGRRETQIDARALDLILFGRDRIDLRALDQLVDRSQTRAIGHGIHLAATRFMDGRATLREVVERVEELLDREGLDVLDPFYLPGRHPGNYARPRKHEMAQAINRLRTLRMTQRA